MGLSLTYAVVHTAALVLGRCVGRQEHQRWEESKHRAETLDFTPIFYSSLYSGVINSRLCCRVYGLHLVWYCNLVGSGHLHESIRCLGEAQIESRLAPAKSRFVVLTEKVAASTNFGDNVVNRDLSVKAWTRTSRFAKP
jgi:hypothetical protein